ncbi:Excreted virulence factor EspC, type VII ESX diderm [Lentzea xinjiangensis]|uniref:Excreted virulence factor EspC, type VII ESX diderm n=1 Tax=Lentzea xinjiangensis TaxID=402600 RepID=A0A1H9W2C5_9PSEU|nr:transglycosylase SLT domain-containing protein [Lentzea xinjiangensis]SES27929.1 Excreted virulence factor EspC, type VII ESX diderm [Lentzea xinjiangensis]
MSRLSPEQIAQHARAAGFHGQGLTIAVAVALAESNGDPRAHNNKPPDDSYGLWQINMLGAMGPERRRQYGLDSNRELFDPRVNAEVANSLSGDGRSWTPWTTYTSGAYRKYLDVARRAARGTTGGTPPRRAGSGGDGFAVDPAALDRYARRGKDIADDLASIGTRHVRQVGEIAGDSFGRIGKETGFASALEAFGAALHRQVDGVGRNADRLARSTGRLARAYRDQDDVIADHLGRG